LPKDQPKETPIQSPPKPTTTEDKGPEPEESEKVETETILEKRDNPEPETKSAHTEELNLDSNNDESRAKPSISTQSNQGSSTHEHSQDLDAMPEATAGGPEIISVSSTSKLSASIGVQEEEFINMQKSDPAGMLRLLLSKKQQQQSTSGEPSNNDSGPSNVEINSQVRQDSLLLRLTKDFAQRDLLKQLDENPACAYNHLAFLKKLHNPLTSESTLGKVIQLGSIIDQYAKAVQKKIENGTRLSTQQQAHAMFYEKAQNAQMEVESLAKQTVEENPGIVNCNKNIAFYEQQIGFLEAQIKDYKRKIFEEQTRKAQIQEELQASTQERIDAKGREGIEAFSAAEVVAEEIKALESSNLVVDRELTTLKKIYSECVKDL
jgi:hypothetical protein